MSISTNLSWRIPSQDYTDNNDGNSPNRPPLSFPPSIHLDPTPTPADPPPFFLDLPSPRSLGG